MKYTMSTIDAAKIAKCSIHAIVENIRRGYIEAIQIPSPTRLVWRINKQSFAKFYNTRVKGNSRYNRIMPKAAEYQPYVNKGYRYIKCPDHARASFQGYVPEHVLVIENKIGRKVRKGEEVHHLNGIKLDNRPENLVLFSSRSEHHKKGHDKFMKVRTSFVQLFRSDDFEPSLLTPEQKIELFDRLVKDALS